MSRWMGIRGIQRQGCVKRNSDRIRRAFRLELAHHMGAMNFDGTGAYAQLLCYGPILEA